MTIRESSARGDFGPLSVVLLGGSAAAVGFAIHANDGAYSLIGLAVLAVAIVGALAVFFLPPDLARARSTRLVVPVLCAAALAELAAHAWTPITPAFPIRGAALLPFFAGVGSSALLVVAIAFAPPRVARVAMPLAIVVFAATAIWVVNQADPVIDVFMFQQRSARALLHGKNPWALTFPNPYSHTRFYGPGLVVNGRLQFGYPYFPLPLLLVLPSFLLKSDVRFAHVVALAISAALIAYARPSRAASLSAAILLFSPRIFLILLLGWIEPLVVLTFALLVFVLVRRPRLSPYAFGFFLAIKQYLVFVPVFVGLVVRPPSWRDVVRYLAIAAAVTLVITVPFALWNVRAFVHSALTLQLSQPFRNDALSFAALLAHLGGPQSSGLAFVAVLPVLWIAARRAPRTAAGFAAAVAATYLVFFGFNKQAFANYYLFVIGALTTAAGAAEESS